jgi:enoyl-CoA hydratase
MSGQATSDLLINHADSILSVRLNAPQRLNALSAAAFDAIAEAVDRASRDRRIRAVVLNGEGRAFCAGADLGDMAATGLDKPNTVEVDPTTLDAVGRLTTAVTNCHKPVVCGLNGIAAGVGASIALACDLIIAKRSAAFLLSFSKVGLMPDGGATALVAASIGRHRALSLALLAEPLSADDAATAGLVYAVVDDEQFDDVLDAVTGRLVAGPVRALAETKRAINTTTLHALPEALQRERESQLNLMAGAEYREGATAFLQRRVPDFRGATS